MLNTILLQSSGGAADYSGIIMIVAMIAIFYFFMIRPQNKRQKKIRDERAALQKGDRIVTAGGIHGKIREKRDTTCVVEIAEGVKITVELNSIYPAANADDAQQAMTEQSK